MSARPADWLDPSAMPMRLATTQNPRRSSIQQASTKAAIHTNNVAARVGTDPKRVEIIPGATHLFEEPSKLEEVARLAREWFQRYLNPHSPST